MVEEVVGAAREEVQEQAEEDTQDDAELERMRLAARQALDALDGLSAELSAGLALRGIAVDQANRMPSATSSDASSAAESQVEAPAEAPVEVAAEAEAEVAAQAQAEVEVPAEAQAEAQAQAEAEAEVDAPAEAAEAPPPPASKYTPQNAMQNASRAAAQRQQLGNVLLTKLAPRFPNLAGKITGMLLDLGPPERRRLMSDGAFREAMVQEALCVLATAGDERAMPLAPLLEGEGEGEAEGEAEVEPPEKGSGDSSGSADRADRGAGGAPAVVAVGLGCAASMPTFPGSAPLFVMPAVPGRGASPPMSMRQMRTQMMEVRQQMLAAQSVGSAGEALISSEQLRSDLL